MSPQYACPKKQQTPTMAEPSTFQLSCCPELGSLPLTLIRLEYTKIDGVIEYKSLDQFLASEATASGAKRVKTVKAEGERFRIPSNTTNACLSIRGDYYFRFGNQHKGEYVQDGFVKLNIKAGDEVLVVDYLKRNPRLEVPHITLQLKNPRTPHLVSLLTCIQDRNIKCLYKEEDVWKLEELEFVDEVTEDPVETVELKVNVPPYPTLKLVTERYHFMFSNEHHQASLVAIDPSEWPNDERFEVQDNVLLPVQSGDRVVIERIPRFNEEDVQKEFHRLLFEENGNTSTRLTTDRLWSLLHSKFQGRVSSFCENPISKASLKSVIEENEAMLPPSARSRRQSEYSINLNKVFQYPFLVEGYFRAFGLSPGGNIHNNTIRYC